jgi:hypothetical protein
MDYTGPCQRSCPFADTVVPRPSPVLEGTLIDRSIAPSFYRSVERASPERPARVESFMSEGPMSEERQIRGSGAPSFLGVLGLGEG